ncbi:MAG: hypothetical protein LBS69_02450, partial [Prevotellaceae bacterium]|nr:hypothetical protein [Prevotellaceae bacterium]
MKKKVLQNRSKTKALLLLSVCIVALMWQSCTDKREPIEVDSDYRIDMAFTKKKHSQHGDSLFLYFKIKDKNGKKVKIDRLDNPDNIDSLACDEVGNGAVSTGYKITKINKNAENQQDLVSKNSLFWFLIDRTNVNQDDLEQIKGAIEQTLEKLPDSTVYISFVDKPKENRLIGKDCFAEIENEFKVQKTGKSVCSSVLEQLSKFAEEYGKTDKECYLLVCTDGKLDYNNNNEKTSEFFEEREKINTLYRNSIITHAFRYGNDTVYNFVCKGLCQDTVNPKKNGHFYAIENSAAVSDTIASFISSDLAYDYQLTSMRKRVFDNDYIGQNLSLTLYIKTVEGKTMFGTIDNYTLGSVYYPITGNLDNFFISLLLSIFIIVIIYFIIQVLIPYITSKREKFQKKHIVKYKPGENVTMECCYFCKEPFVEDEDDVVVKCQHKMHDYCWKENGYKCTDYGRGCREGIEHRFDKEHAFDLKSGPFYRKWAIAGAIGGFIIGIIHY